MADTEIQMTLFETAAQEKPAQTREIRFPRRCQLDTKINGNAIRRIDFVAHTRVVRVASFSRGRTSGYVLDGGKDRHTFATPRPTSAILPCDDILYVPAEDNFDAILSGIESGLAQWLKPRPTSLLSETFEQAEGRCERIIESWADRFEFREEREAGGVLFRASAGLKSALSTQSLPIGASHRVPRQSSCRPAPAKRRRCWRS
jgi:hypothetical protein